MKKNRLALVGFCLFSTASISHESTTVGVSLFELIRAYADEYGTNFVVEPSLNRMVRIGEEELTSIDSSTFLDSITCSGLVAMERDQLVFIISVEEAIASGSSFERLWPGGASSLRNHQKAAR